MSTPEIDPATKTQYLTEIIGILEASGERMGTVGEGSTYPVIGTALRGITPRSMQLVFSETMRVASEILDVLGGMPLSHDDERTGIKTEKIVFDIAGFDAEAKSWHLVALPDGNLPIPSRLVVANNELRDAFYQANHQP